MYEVTSTRNGYVLCYVNVRSIADARHMAECLEKEDPSIKVIIYHVHYVLTKGSFCKIIREIER